MTSTTSSRIETATMLRRLVFFILLAGFAVLHLLPLFRGLSSPQAMEQAQIAREIARGNGAVTKVIRPLAYDQAEKANQGAVAFSGFKDTYHAPLNPIVIAAALKIVGADAKGLWEIGANEHIYVLDRVVASVSTLAFVLAIGVTYFLIRKVFNAKISGVTVLLMLLCDLFWQFSQSGLPQMLLLLFFSCGLYFAYLALEASQEGRMSIIHAVVASVFFVLMVLTHWITVWIFLGFLTYSAIAFRPRGVVALVGLVVLALGVAIPMIRAANFTGQPFGTAFYVLYNGLASGAESTVMRNHDLDGNPLSLDGLALKVLATTLVQLSDLLPFFGGILVAPIFFIALIHPFKRASIAHFRWGILLMWVFAALGMSIFGVSRDVALHPNQIHILFAPIMAAYGLAFISIMWSKVESVHSVPFLKNAHYIAVVVLSCAPMLLSMPNKVKIGLAFRDRGLPQWPPYMPLALNSVLPKLLAPSDGEAKKTKIVVSDQPWAVAWYADEISLWLPMTTQGFDQLEDKALALGTPFAGILITPSSFGTETAPAARALYGDFTSLVFNGFVIGATAPAPFQVGVSISDKDPKISDIQRRYPHLEPIVATDMMFYGERRSATTP